MILKYPYLCRWKRSTFKQITYPNPYAIGRQKGNPIHDHWPAGNHKQSPIDGKVVDPALEKSSINKTINVPID
jgi:hypothetical protein